ncbi:MAG: glycosyltransferase [Clostridia bacterium]|nr:glycosyltransferase [Clostridia bacterium]
MIGIDNIHPRVLIVGTVPYDKNMSSRAFDAYFHNWEKENLRQFFSNPNQPLKGHCSSLYQITDQMMLARRFKKTANVGILYNYDELPNSRDVSSKGSRNGIIGKLYALGRKKTSLNRLARKWLWKEKYWNTEKFRNWIDEFAPECVFLAFSDDFFINRIALFIADRFGIPIMTCIGDDYYFNDKRSLSPFYCSYRKQYKKTIDRVFAHKCSAIYISDKIRDKYNREFSIKGDTVYLTSDIPRKEFSPINVESPKITYCGNIRLGRNHSIVDVANALSEINKDYKVEVFSPECDSKYTKVLENCSNVVFHGAIPYDDVIKVFKESDVVLIVEGFEEKDVNLTRYSLSTKAADSITSGCQILTYGSSECGVIEYMKGTGCSMVCTDRSHLVASIKTLMDDVALQKKLYDRSYEILMENHSIEKSNKKAERLFEELLNGDDSGV